MFSNLHGGGDAKRILVRVNLGVVHGRLDVIWSHYLWGKILAGSIVPVLSAIMFSPLIMEDLPNSELYRRIQNHPQ